MINSHNGWSQLEEVWLGDIYPASWYDHLEPAVRDVFQHITEITQEDLNIIEHKLTEFGVTVRRPEYNSIDDFVASSGQLIKPEICPRDTFLTLGDTLLTPNKHNPAWANTIDLYRNAGCTVSPGSTHIVNGANVVRAGRDVIVDTDVFAAPELPTAFDNYRITWEKNGGHMDGCFAILQPGLIIANHYYDGYDRNFPGWECIFLNEPTYWNHRKSAPPGGEYNGKFYAEGIAFNRSFNEHVIRHAQNWVGDYTETYFELNCLSLDPHNVMMLGYNAALEQTLNQHGITVHWVPFRCRGFWDGGMHCITTDIRRRSSIEDYFPDRS